MFNAINTVITYSMDNSTCALIIYQYHLWRANLRVLEIEEIKSLPHILMSHPFVERLIGSIRREPLDQTLFWTATDLENKLRSYQLITTSTGAMKLEKVPQLPHQKTIR